MPLIPVVIAQIQACSSPDAVQWILITALVAGMIGSIGVFAASTVVAITSVATTIVNGILTGASIAAIAAAIQADIGTTSLSLGLIAMIVGQIKQILGC